MKNITLKGFTDIGNKLFDLNVPMSVIPHTCEQEHIDVDVFAESMDSLWYYVIRSTYAKKSQELLEELNIQNPDYIRDSVYSSFWTQFEGYNPTQIFYVLKKYNYITEDEYYNLRNTDLYDTRFDSFRGKSVQDILEIIGTEPTNLEGRFTKRFQAHLYKEFGYRLSADQLTCIGNLYNAARLTRKNYIVEITNNFSWDDGQFSKDGSCWWGSYSDSRDTLYSYGGYALLVYPDLDNTHKSDGIGRTWIYPKSDDLVVTFNSYGIEAKESAAIVAKLLEKVTGKNWKYGKRGILNTGSDTNFPYINGDNGHNSSGGGKCYAIYSETRPSDIISIHMERKSGVFDNPHKRRCEFCRQWHDMNDITTTPDGDVICQRCYNDNFVECAGCGESVHNDDALSFAEEPENVYCRECFNRRRTFTCDYCGIHYSLTAPIIYENAEICPNCMAIETQNQNTRSE